MANNYLLSSALARGPSEAVVRSQRQSNMNSDRKKWGILKLVAWCVDKKLDLGEMLRVEISSVISVWGKACGQ
ncbi:MAG: hypothetical protein ACJ0Q2_08720 [Candidatus Azotimanducaceae bacterium]